MLELKEKRKYGKKEQFHKLYDFLKRYKGGLQGNCIYWLDNDVYKNCYYRKGKKHNYIKWSRSQNESYECYFFIYDKLHHRSIAYFEYDLSGLVVVQYIKEDLLCRCGPAMKIWRNDICLVYFKRSIFQKSIRIV